MKTAALTLLTFLAGLWCLAAPPPAKQPARKTYVAPKGKAAPKNRYQQRYSRRWTPPPRPMGPQQPSADRYKEVQQALAQKGYLSSEPSGEWKQDSVDALKRFQQDQKLEVNGKLDSLSIIALGLGPKRAAAVQPPAAPKEQP